MGTEVKEKDGKPLFDPTTNSGKHVLSCMADIGYDLSNAKRKQLIEKIVKETDLIIAMTDKVNLPDYVKNSPKLKLWYIQDAQGTDYTFTAKIRDQLKRKVEELVKELD